MSDYCRFKLHQTYLTESPAALGDTGCGRISGHSCIGGIEWFGMVIEEAGNKER